MASELFRSELPDALPSGAARRVLPLSIAAHVVVLGAVFTAPLLGDIDFPPPNRPLPYAYTSIELPLPPPVWTRSRLAIAADADDVARQGPPSSRRTRSSLTP